MDLKKLLYKMLIKYYLSDNINVSFEDFDLGLRNAWADLSISDLNTHIWA